MKIFLATFTVLALAVIGMAVGVILSNRKLKGSCGGLSAVGIDKTCGCENPCERRLKRIAEAEQQASENA